MEQRWERCAELDVLSDSVTASGQMAGPSQQGTQHFQTCGTTAADFLPLGIARMTTGAAHVALESTRAYWEPFSTS
jgi:hypothetical protein